MIKEIPKLSQFLVNIMRSYLLRLCVRVTGENLRVAEV